MTIVDTDAFLIVGQYSLRMDAIRFPCPLIPEDRLFHLYGECHILVCNGQLYGITKSFDEAAKLAQSVIPPKMFYSIRFVNRGITIFSAGMYQH
jgi:hypothetical protein